MESVRQDRLVNQLRECLHYDLTDPIWETFIAEGNRIITPCLRTWIQQIKRMKTAAGWAFRAGLLEVADLRQTVWERLLHRDAWALHGFHGELDVVLRRYLLRITGSVIQNYLKQPEVRLQIQAIHSWEDWPPCLAQDERLTYGTEKALEASLQIGSYERWIRDAGAGPSAARRVRIFQLRRQGLSPAEISRVPGLALSKQAVGKIIAKQDEMIRSTVAGIHRKGGSPAV